MSDLEFGIEFLFGANNQLFIKPSASWKGDALPMSLSGLLTFLFQHEKEIDPTHSDFAYALAKLISKVKWGNDLLLAIAGDTDQGLFFKRVVDSGIPLNWTRRDTTSPVIINGPLPLYISITTQSSALVCTLQNQEQFLTDPLYQLMFAWENMTFMFCDGVLMVNPSRDFYSFLCRFLDKPRVYLGDEHAMSFIQKIYTPNKDNLHWDLKANLDDFSPKQEPPKAILRLTMEDRVMVPKIFYKYGKTIIGPEDTRSVIKDAKTNRLLHRLPDMEKIYQDDLMALYMEHELPFLLENPAHIAAFLHYIVPTLQQREWKVESDVPSYQIHPEAVSVEFGVSQLSDKNWFHFTPNCNVLGQDMSLQEIARLMVQGQGYIQTKSGYVKLSKKTQEEIQLLSQMGALRSDAKFSKAEILPMLMLTNSKGEDKASKTLLEQLDGLNQIQAVRPGKDFKGTLRDYQQLGINWLNFLDAAGFGGILADDMGLGKTIQTLAFASQMQEPGPVLVVGPTNVMYNWQSEIAKFLPKKKSLVYTGSDRTKHLKKLDKVDFFITSFGVLKNDLEWLKSGKWRAVFIDEAQAIKNPSTQVSKAVKSLSARFKLAMTGTPIENHLQDLWNLFDFVMPGYLGSAGAFSAAFEDGKADVLKNKIRPFVMRREKGEVLDSLPPKTEIILKCPMSSAQQALYQTVLKAAISGIKTSTGKKDRLNVLTALLKLRQVCLHPGLLAEFDGHAMESAKFDLAKEKILEVVDEGHKIVLFSQFTKMLDFVEDWTKDEKIYFERIDGSVTGKSRMDRIERFQKSDKPGVFLISLKAGGVGINLTSASYVIHLDPWWNPAVEAQATDRVHRMGQENKVFVYKFITEGTVEEKINLLQEEKRQLLGQLIDVDNLQDSKIDIEELRSILLS